MYFCSYLRNENGISMSLFKMWNLSFIRYRGGVTLSARCARAHPVFGSDKCKDLCGHTQFLLRNVPEKDFVKPKKIWITSWLPWSFQCPICSLAERGCVIVRQNIPGLSWIFSFENQNKNKQTNADLISVWFRVFSNWCGILKRFLWSNQLSDRKTCILQNSTKLRRFLKWFF